jgi:twitching motility protein PilT
MAKIDTLLKLMIKYNASDMHISVGTPPMFRIYGELRKLEYHNLTQEESKILLYELLHEDEIKQLERQFDLDVAYEIPGEARFRGNMFFGHRGVGAVFRIIPKEIKPIEKLNMPPVVRELASLTKGLVVVTGPTGSGKSTTLASMIDMLNKERRYHIITLEDPIEFIHENKLSLIVHRQIGIHCESFATGLRAALREDPNVILVGEMRDLNTISLALTAAETGLLVMGTLHTSSAAKTVDRIIDVFSSDQQAQIRTMLAESLRGVIAQKLVRTADGEGRVAAVEILVVTNAISNLIREGKTYQISTAIQTGKNEGMQSLDQHLMHFVDKGVVAPQEAYKHANDRAMFKKFIKSRTQATDSGDSTAKDE